MHHDESVPERAVRHAAWKAARATRYGGGDHARDLQRTAAEYRVDAARAGLEMTEQRELIKARAKARVKAENEPKIDIRPLTFDDRSANELRPARFDQMVGQPRLKGLMARIVANVQTSGRPLDHIMLAGQSGTGKTTLAQVTAHELGRNVYQTKAPVTHVILRALQRVCIDGDVVIVDEIHQQVQGDRRGITQAADPEDFYHIMEDRRLPTQGGMTPFPAVTFIGATTDEGLLPEAFLNRFPLRLTLDPYSWDDMSLLAAINARQLGIPMTADAARMFGRASRRNPRQINTFVRNGTQLGCHLIDAHAAGEVVFDLNGYTWDGLTRDMQGMLRTLLSAPKHRASVSTIATALGHSRDVKAVQLYVEPYLISEGYVAVAAGVGRVLTDTGVKRAMELS